MSSDAGSNLYSICDAYINPELLYLKFLCLETTCNYLWCEACRLSTLETTATLVKLLHVYIISFQPWTFVRFSLQTAIKDLYHSVTSNHAKKLARRRKMYELSSYSPNCLESMHFTIILRPQHQFWNSRFTSIHIMHM